MSRALLIIEGPHSRGKAHAWVEKAPIGTRLEFKAAKRTLPQNDRMWAMLTDIASQKEHNGRKYTPEIWKVLFMHGWQREVQMVPSLDGREVIPLTRSSDLSKQELSEMLEFMAAWAANNGVVLHDPKAIAA